MTEWLGNCQEKFYQFAGRKVKSMGNGAEDRGQTTEVGGRKPEIRGQTTEDRNFPVGAAFSRDSNDFYDFNDLII